MLFPVPRRHSLSNAQRLTFCGALFVGAQSEWLRGWILPNAPWSVGVLSLRRIPVVMKKENLTGALTECADDNTIKH